MFFKKNKDFNCIVIGINHPFVESFNNEFFTQWLKENEVGSVSNKKSFKEDKFFDTNYFYNHQGIKIPIFIDLNADNEAIFTKTKTSGTCQFESSFINEYRESLLD